MHIGINAGPLKERKEEKKKVEKLPGRAVFSVVGDVHAEDVSHVAGAMTCVPGGAGPMTIAALLSNTFLGASRRDRRAARRAETARRGFRTNRVARDVVYYGRVTGRIFVLGYAVVDR